MSPEELREVRWSCRGCDAWVVTAYSKNGKRMCVDAMPNDAGNLDLVREQLPGETQPLIVARIHQAPAQDETLFEVESRPEYLYLDHHVLCPDAGLFRQT